VERFRLGVDENGLGPRLGPLVVTAVVARVTEEGHVIASRRPKGSLAKRLGDSKAMIAHGDVALGEAWARAVARRTGLTGGTPDDLIHGFVLDRSPSCAGCAPLTSRRNVGARAAKSSRRMTSWSAASPPISNVSPHKGSTS